MKNVKVLLNKTMFKAKKYSPEIFITIGVAGTVASTVLACRATTKLSGILDEAAEQLDTISSCSNDPEYKDRYTEEDAKKDTTIVYAKTGANIVKLYAPAVALGVVSLGCIISSNNILRKRNVALAAAYTTLDKSYKEYRKRVIDRFGEEVEHQIRHNIKAVEIEETVVNGKGKEKKVTKTVETCELDGYSEYSRFFDDGCKGWEKDPEYNLTFLRAQQQYANDLLRANGYLFLNDVYDMLGIPRSKAGQVVGWVYNEENPNGDNYVDFGIYDLNKSNSRDFVNGIERTILLDFNVDGNIWDLM